MTMLRAATAVTCATPALRRAAFSVPAIASPGLRFYRSSPRSSGPLSATLTAGLSSSATSSPSCFAASLTQHKRSYACKTNRHDSNTEDVSNTFFDVQDVDADRLTHFYWDSNDDADTPYDAGLLDSWQGEGEMDEWSGESLRFVDKRDHPLLDEEYLR